MCSLFIFPENLKMYFIKGPSDLKSELLQCLEEVDGEVVEQEELLYVLGVGKELKSLVSRQIGQLFPNSVKTRIRRGNGSRMYPQIVSFAYYNLFIN